MPESVRDFYDQLATDYHLIYADWPNSVRRQGAVLDRLIKSMVGGEARAVLDCACGIGTQAIGLALRGYEVTATDLSEASVDRARTEAQAFEAQVSFGIADFRDLEPVGGSYDVVIACDNALPHLVDDADLKAAAASMRARLRDGGLLVASTRDYDEASMMRPTTTETSTFDGPGGRRIVFQVWDWAPDGRTYVVNLFILRGVKGEWSMTHHATTYRALRRAELTAVLAEAGFTAVRWHTPAETGYFQPVVTARA
jgi:glycine/sarcosine N-methyltransferase